MGFGSLLQQTRVSPDVTLIIRGDGADNMLRAVLGTGESLLSPRPGLLNLPTAGTL